MHPSTSTTFNPSTSTTYRKERQSCRLSPLELPKPTETKFSCVEKTKALSKSICQPPSCSQTVFEGSTSLNNSRLIEDGVEGVLAHLRSVCKTYDKLLDVTIINNVIIENNKGPLVIGPFVGIRKWGRDRLKEGHSWKAYGAQIITSTYPECPASLAYFEAIQTYKKSPFLIQGRDDSLKEHDLNDLIEELPKDKKKFFNCLLKKTIKTIETGSNCLFAEYLLTLEEKIDVDKFGSFEDILRFRIPKGELENIFLLRSLAYFISTNKILLPQEKPIQPTPPLFIKDNLIHTWRIKDRMVTVTRKQEIFKYTISNNKGELIEKEEVVFDASASVIEKTNHIKRCFPKLGKDNELTLIPAEVVYKSCDQKKRKVQLVQGNNNKLMWQIYKAKDKSFCIPFAKSTLKPTDSCSEETKEQLGKLSSYDLNQLKAVLINFNTAIIKKDLPPKNSCRIFLEPITAVSQLDPRVKVSAYQLAVTLIRTKGATKSLNNHAEILIEGVEGGKYSASFTDFTGEIIRHEQIKGQLRYEGRSKTWKRTRSLVEKMIEKIEEDKKHPPKFNLLGWKSMFGHEKLEKGHSCISWATVTLALANIHLKEKGHSFIVMNTNDYAENPKKYKQLSDACDDPYII